ncbi:aromatic-ring-hydroxylating dioxygenase subunit beta [Sulfolobus sp. SCGC AB-777_L09]|nr:aromatic-ring-hydroxylating dioxygenase subunit beta [Sulfolobus sp. SCGC AB-777_L09]
MTIVLSKVDEKTKEEILEFLYKEIELLENQNLEEWIKLVDENIEYIAPYRLTMKRGSEQVTSKMTYFNDDIRSLTLRVKKFGTQYIWSEDPPARYRYHITRVKIESNGDPNMVNVHSVILLFVTRFDYDTPQIISYERKDTLVKKNGEWKLLRREVILDHSLTPYLIYTRFL